jgi:D-arabinose 5-phosphate isomerase GutQ
VSTRETEQRRDGTLSKNDVLTLLSESGRARHAAARLRDAVTEDQRQAVLTMLQVGYIFCKRE